MPMQEAARPWSAGAVVGGRYRLVAPLGAGAMGEVWRADQLAIAAPVAVKLLDIAAAPDPANVRARFLEEARVAAQLKSAHAVRILDHGVEGRVAFIAMELLEGETLGQRLERVGRLAPREVALIVGEIALALAQAHEAGIVHRDLKPQNVFLARVDGREVAKILDFGIAKRAASVDTHLQTHAGVVVGTPAYMSPEQALGQRIDLRSDLWQLGAITYECVVGHCPFAASTLGALFMAICSGPVPVPSAVADVPPGFDAWIARALAKPPEERFQSARELAAALGAVLAPGLALPAGGTVNPLDSGTFAARAASIAELETMHTRSGEGRSRRARLVGGAILAAVALAAGVAWHAAQDDATPTARAAPASSLAPPPPSGAPAPSATAPPTTLEPLDAGAAEAPSAAPSGLAPATPRGRLPRAKRPEDELGI